MDWEALRRAYPGEALRFQLRERGQALGTAQWHVPEAMFDAPPPAARAIPPVRLAAAGTPAADPAPAEVQRLREDLAASRAESSVWAEEARRLRTEVERERTARVRAETECDLARKAEESARAEAATLRDRLHAAALDRRESEIAFRLLGGRVPLELQDVHRLVAGRR